MIDTISAALRRGILALAVVAGITGFAGKADAVAEYLPPQPGIWVDAHGRYYLIGRVGDHFKVALLVATDNDQDWFVFDCPKDATRCERPLQRYTDQENARSEYHFRADGFQGRVAIRFDRETSGTAEFIDNGTGERIMTFGLRPAMGTPSVPADQQPHLWWTTGGDAPAGTLAFLWAPAGSNPTGEARGHDAALFLLTVDTSGNAARMAWTRADGQMNQGNFAGSAAEVLRGTNFPIDMATNRVPTFTPISGDARMRVVEETGRIDGMSPATPRPYTVGKL